MGGKRQYKGVEVRDGKVRIWFQWNGKRKYETTELRPTSTGLAAASRLRVEIQTAIATGTFRIREWFPHSTLADEVETTTFGVIAARWLAHKKTSRALSTVKGYRKMLNRYWLPYFGDDQINAINTGHIRDTIADIGFHELSAKTFNNALTPLRGVFELAKEDEAIHRNPCDPIEWKKWTPPPPDPLLPEEIPILLTWLKKKRPEWLNYFQLAIGSGMRTSELIALKWSDIDWTGGFIRVQRGYVEQQEKGTKTGVVRDVEITSMALEALQRQKSETLLMGDLVFLNHGKQIVGDKPPRLAWNAALKATKIRDRVAYCTRDTFASIALSSGAPPYEVAQQLGHSYTTLIKHYARWLPDKKRVVSRGFDEAVSEAGS